MPALEAPARFARFAIVSANYFPRTCGVGDHSMRLAEELLRRGAAADVFAFGNVSENPEAPQVRVNAVGGVRPTARVRAMRDAVLAWGATHAIVQYTAQSFGGSRFGHPAAPWLVRSLRRSGVDVTLLAHELFTPWAVRPDLAVGALAHRLQLAATMRAASRVFVTTDTRAIAVRSLSTLAGSHAEIGVLRVGPNALPIVPPGPKAGAKLGVFSTLGVGKRADVALDALAVVAAERSDSELWWMGDLGPPDAPPRRRLLERMAASGLSSRVHLTGKLPLREIARIVAELDVYLFPMDTGANTRSGTLPLALGCGLPSVATRGRDTDPVFQDGENVLFADALDGRAFGKAALRILRDDALRARVGAGARKLYDEHLAWGVQTERLLRACRLAATRGEDAARHGIVTR